MNELQHDTKQCPRCQQVKPKSDFYVCRPRKDGLSHKCKDCINTLNQRPEAKATAKKYLAKNKSKRRIYSTQWRQKNLDARLKKEKQYRVEYKRAAIEHYGGKCECCDEKEYDFLAIDHINGGGTKHRKTLKGGNGIYKWLKANDYPSGFRVLCHNRNWGIHVNNGICPHKKIDSI